MSELARSQRVDNMGKMIETEVPLDEHDEARKLREKEEKRQEVRKRLEEAGNKNKSKKGFLTPERKKKLRKLLMLKAAEDLKRQQVEKEQQRIKILAERIIPLPEVDDLQDRGQLEGIYNTMYERVCKLEEDKYDIAYKVKHADECIRIVSQEVNDLKGKYVKPSLKKVSKYDNKFKKMAQTGEAKNNKPQPFQVALKKAKKDINEELNTVGKKDEKPDWTKKPLKVEEAAKEDENPAAETKEETEPEAPQEKAEEENEEGEEANAGEEVDEEEEEE